MDFAHASQRWTPLRDRHADLVYIGKGAETEPALENVHVGRKMKLRCPEKIS